MRTREVGTRRRMTENVTSEIDDQPARRIDEVLDGVRVAMLTTDTDDGLEARPLTIVAQDADTLWFLVSRSAHWVNAATLSGQDSLLAFEDARVELRLPRGHSASTTSRRVRDCGPRPPAVLRRARRSRRVALAFDVTGGRWWDGPDSRIGQSLALAGRSSPRRVEGRRGGPVATDGRFDRTGARRRPTWSVPARPRRGTSYDVARPTARPGSAMATTVVPRPIDGGVHNVTVDPDLPIEALRGPHHRYRARRAARDLGRGHRRHAGALRRRPGGRRSDPAGSRGRPSPSTSAGSSRPRGAARRCSSARWPTDRYVRPFAGIGFIGAYTTFSTFIVEADVLAKDGHLGTAAAYVGASLLGGLAAVALGSGPRSVGHGPRADLMLIAWLIVGGAVGAPARYLVDGCRGGPRSRTSSRGARSSST